MIKGIQKIKCLGVFEDYNRPSGIQDFALKNLIYGWNYSGKTTLSRLFSMLETKQINPDLAGCSFTFDTDKGPVTEANFASADLNVRVFNADFIARNLNFAGKDFNPILLLGKESEEAQRRLDQCEETARKVRELITSHERETQRLENDFGVAKTKEAAKIKKDIGRVEAYTSTHLDKDISHIELLDESKTLSDEQLKTDLKLALTSDQERPSKVEKIVISPSIDDLHGEALVITAATPSLTNTIEHLVANPLIERWVGDGLPLHTEKDKCDFCGSDLSRARLADLKAHFSKDLTEHKQKIQALIKRVEQAKISFNLPKEAELNAQFRERYKQLISDLPDAVNTFNRAVDVLGDDLRKKVDAPFKSQEPTPIGDGLAELVTKAVANINAVITENNNVADNFTVAKREAVDRVRYHYVQEFLENINKDAHERNVARRHMQKSRLTRFGQTVQQEILNLRAFISQAQLGRAEINQRLISMLGSDSVQIDVVSIGGQDRFQLVRQNGRIAKNLSDGEKTAIAFTYFLTKLKEIKPEEFKETIVYIDDPISSLDSNHIFQITAIIKGTFFQKNPASGAWETTCKQVFISTHNFDFFSLVRELDPKKSGAARMFLIKRIKSKESTLCEMPKSLGGYSSEYHFLFEIIYRFHTAPDKTDHEVMFLLPNAVRRFVELYTFSRIPGGIDSKVDHRAEKLFGTEKAKRILKVIHYFSHANSIERLATNNELICDIDNAITDLFDEIRRIDKMHMEALEASVTP